MSLDATLWAWKHYDVSPLQKLIMLSLADRANDQNYCYPSIDRLAIDTNSSRSTVIRALSALESMGHILKIKRHRDNGDNQSNIYQLMGVQNREGAVLMAYYPQCQSDTPPSVRVKPPQCQSDTLIYNIISHSESPTEPEYGADTKKQRKSKVGSTDFAACKQAAPVDDVIDAEYTLEELTPSSTVQVQQPAPVDMSDIPEDDLWYHDILIERMAKQADQTSNTQNATESPVIACDAFELSMLEQYQDKPVGAITDGKKTKLAAALTEKTTQEAKSKGTAVWNAYALAYTARYGCDPILNAKTNGCIAQMIKRIGADDAEKVAGFYPTHNARWYVQKCHDVGSMLADCEKLRMEVLTGRMVTTATAVQADRTAGNMGALSEAWEMIDREAMAA